MKKGNEDDFVYETAVGLGASLALACVNPLLGLGTAAYFTYKALNPPEKKKNSDSIEVLPPERTDDYPTTVAARRSPYETASFLKYKAEEETYRSSLISATSIAKNYLDSLPEGALDNSRGLNVRVSRRNTGLVSFLSSESEEINMRIRVK
ncbi:MAG: hypothetical protein QW103_00210 [Candidatus Pacearchaeota archaeon]